MPPSRDHDPDVWIAAVRASHDRLSGLLSALPADDIRARSYDTGWSIAQVASHLGSQAEIFGLFLEAGLGDGELPGSDRFQQIWARWDRSTPDEQVRASIGANEAFLARLEGLSADQRDGFHATLFGNPADLVGLLTMRLSEHAVHTWDVAVALDPSATIAPDAVALLIDTALAGTVTRASAPADPPQVIALRTTAPERSFVLTTGPTVSLTPDETGGGIGERTANGTGEAGANAGETLTIPAEALLRLVYGRLDVDHTPAALESQQELLDRLRPVFPGF